jgi:hypothetical protein
MRIRLIENGYQTFTGQFGVWEFADGVSVDDLDYLAAMNITSLLSVVDDATGEYPSNTPYESGGPTASAPTETSTYSEALESAPAAAAAIALGDITRASLEAIADESGIKGIRLISDSMGIRGTSITDLIDKILNAVSVTFVKPGAVVSVEPAAAE